MEFRITHDDLQPSELRYYKVMDPLWKQLRQELEGRLDLEWTMRETRGPLNLIAEAEVDDDRIDWIEIRGECAREVEASTDETDEMVVQLEEWFGLVMLGDDVADEISDSGLLRTECHKRVGLAVEGLKNLCVEELDLTL